MPIIQDPHQRAARADEKRRTLMRFLRTELYTSPHVVAELLQIDPRAARSTVAALERGGLVKRHAIKLGDGGSRFWVIGITPLGQSVAFDPEAGETVIARSFEPARFSMVYLKHTLDVQRAYLSAARNGLVKQWVGADRLAAVKKGVKKPDAVCLTTQGERVAVEVERSIKAPRSYRNVLAGHLTAMHQRKWNRVVWASPDEKTSARVKALILGVKRLQIAGIDTPIDPEKHHCNISFCVYKDFPKHLEKE